jgi:hypothetical protein
MREEVPPVVSDRTKWAVTRARVAGGIAMSAVGAVAALRTAKPAADAAYGAQGACPAWSPPV